MAMEQQGERLEKEVRLSYGRGKRSYVSVVREHYLREDLSCGSELCILCKELPSRATISKARRQLSGSVSHYVLPDVECLQNFLELWQNPAVSDLILLQTCLSHLKVKAGRQSYRAARDLLYSSVKRCFLFSNEHHLETFSPRRPGETTPQWHRRLVFRAGVWYANHLQISGTSPTIVIVTQTPHEYDQYSGEGRAEELPVMSVADYLACFLPSHSDLSDLCHSLSLSSLSPSDSTGAVKDFREHWSTQDISEGLKMGRLLQGRLHVSSRHPREEAEVVLSGEMGGGEGEVEGRGKVLILGPMARNRAIHNDRVAIVLLPKSEASNVGDHGGGEGGSVALGAVVGVLEREKRKYVASFEEKAEESRGKTERVLVLPYDARIPKIRIGTRQADLLRSHRIIVSIDTWSSTSQYPDGHFVRSIGPIGDVETETAVIMIEHGLSFPAFSRNLLSELPERERWEVEEEEEERRRDLRETHLVFSIDPQGCEDVDDTLSVRHLKKGVTELGVHIADVSHFVRPGSLTDVEAQRRSTSVYLADRRYDMLPPVLSAHLCSLLSGVDRYAVSVVWKLDQNYNVKDVWFGRTLIRSRYKLSYEVAQQLCDGAAASDIRGDIPELMNLDLSQQDLEKRLEGLRGAVKSLSEIAHCLKQRRSEKGAVYLDSFEVKVVMGEEKGTANIEDLIPKQHLDVHDTIAECMIFANHWVATKIHSSLPTSSLLRRHPPPSQTRFTHLRRCAGVRGFQILTGSNRELAESLDKAVDPHDPEVNKILRTLATQAMSQAEYFSTGSLSPYHSTGSSFHSTGSSFHSTVSPDQFSHYGLALDYYTHFTSPIRRYADVIVHRQLLAVVEEEKRGEREKMGEREREKLPGNVQLAEYCRHMNSRHRAAQLAQMASTEMFQALYFSNHERCVCVGVVYAILTKGVRVQIPRYGVKGVVYLQDKAGLVAQPAAVSEAGHSSVVFASGHLKVEDTRVTVAHPAGQYTLTLLDHVTVRVGVEVSHAHGPSIRLHLMSCCTVDPRERSSPLFTSDRGRKEVLAGVRDDIQTKPVEAPSLSSSSSFSQTQPESSLYCLVQRLHNLSLQDD